MQKELFLEALRDYNEDWTFESLSSKKEPLLASVCGTMKQQPTETTFLGTVVEEKFHLKAVTMSFIPCIPLVSNKLKKMVHPNIAPVELEEGPKQGYFVVNLSKSQTVEEEPAFYFTNGFRPQEEQHDVGNEIHYNT